MLLQQSKFTKGIIVWVRNNIVLMKHGENDMIKGIKEG